MKRSMLIPLAAGALAALLALPALGCGAAVADEPVPVAAQETADGTAPEGWTETLSDASTGSSVSVRIAIEPASVTHADVVRMRMGADCTQAEADALIDDVFGNATLYDDAYQTTKAELGYSILEIKRMMTLSQQERDDFYGGMTQEELAAQLAEVEADYATAPDRTVPREITGALSPSPDQYALQARGVTRTGSAATIEVIESSLWIGVDEDESPGGLLLKGDPDKLIASMLELLHLEDAVPTEQLTVSRPDYGEDTVTKSLFTQNISGLPLAAKCRGVQESRSVDGLRVPYFEPTWNGVSICLETTKNGLISLSMSERGTIVATEREGVALLPFATIRRRFQETIFGQSQFFQTGYGASRYQVTRALLCMVPVAAEDTPGDYLCVPAWNFYGSQEEPDGSVGSATVCLLTLSALDGSVL